MTLQKEGLSSLLGSRYSYRGPGNCSICDHCIMNLGCVTLMVQALDTIEAFQQTKWDEEQNVKIYKRRNLVIKPTKANSWNLQVELSALIFVINFFKLIYVTGYSLKSESCNFRFQFEDHVWLTPAQFMLKSSYWCFSEVVVDQ